MITKLTYMLCVSAIVLTGLFASCSDKTLFENPNESSVEGTELNLVAEVAPKTRLAELGGEGSSLQEQIDNAQGHANLQHLGLYIYYEDDYKADNLTRPYIRNLKCTLNADGNIEPVDGEKKIYIHDRMRVVLFYPYNDKVSDFNKKTDEEEYPISLSDYSQQKYIPYRGETEVNPTNAFFRTIGLSPKHTAKIEVVLVSSNEANFPTDNADLRLVPHIDPVGSSGSGTGYPTDKREKWLDGLTEFKDEGGGLHARQYVAYVWTSVKDDKHHDGPQNDGSISEDHNHSDNDIVKGDVVFTSDKLTLYSTQDVNFGEQRVYRYGYNMDSGEIFIPTSSRLVHDAQSLQEVTFDESSAYQVCDIDLSSIPDWKPKTVINGTYDGGGHKISGLSITTDNMAQVGLFGSINGNSYLRNVNLISPKVSVTQATLGKDTCYVGALCGHVNPRLTDEQIRKLADSMFPLDLAPAVKEELLKQSLQDLFNSTSQLIACRVETPLITVKADFARVGGLCGGTGDKDKQGSYYSKIWDSYTLGGKIDVSVTGNPADYTLFTPLVGGLCGSNNGQIIRSYSTTEVKDLKIMINKVETLASSGFCMEGIYAPIFSKDGKYKVTDCYVKVAKGNEIVGGVKSFDDAYPGNGWVTYTGKWPVYTNDWKELDDGGGNGSQHPSIRSFWQETSGVHNTYPILLWEER